MTASPRKGTPGTATPQPSLIVTPLLPHQRRGLWNWMKRVEKGESLSWFEAPSIKVEQDPNAAEQAHRPSALAASLRRRRQQQAPGSKSRFPFTRSPTKRVSYGDTKALTHDPPNPAFTFPGFGCPLGFDLHRRRIFLPSPANGPRPLSPRTLVHGIVQLPCTGITNNS